jgi:hypothetical protein
LESDGGGPVEQPTTQSAPIDFIYFNGFNLSASLSDMGLLLMVDGQPQVRLSLSFTTAKTLAQELTRAVDFFEKATGTNLLTMTDVQTAYQKASGQ